ncbi:hypothetical protein C2I18_10065 [Paenibacillus sp. PK3_47]|uniref:motility associated factor glycosyltransferase family protein n=1 Tax=Paenibacillus sp. PK3_47 TaxID=2072642 RepID=UPI00201D7348|nr:6-hydroxymethylpterin diphosphokinase MptE-like protein [Paenibacillus sp. PK3_47]UQZ33840.1 hypothetical protein C2I18_10065 [Paenibacillus sp. PK3_47]
MVDVLNSNIDILSNNPKYTIGMPDTSKIKQVVSDTDDSGNEILFIDNKAYVQKCEFDDSNQPNSFKRELIFVIGIYSVEEIRKLISMVNNQSLIVIIEPNTSVFNYTLHNKDLSFFESPNIYLYADNLDNLPSFLDMFFLSDAIFYLKNIKFYFTYFYREHGIDSSIAIVRMIKEMVGYKGLMYGNSVEDSLIGFRHHMKNLKHLSRSKDISLLKNAMRNVPAVVVAAGPSLNKNIKELLQLKDKAIIIAVDTIAQRLCNEGIIPDFICSIERGIETYTYFYEGKTYPVESALVGPLVLYPQIFEEYPGELVIPMRERVGEFIWLKEILELKGDYTISIGLSCAHVALGVAEHLGASPIILVGQDLAYGTSEEETHAGGTIYDDKELADSLTPVMKTLKTEGYNGGEVATTEIWNAFRTWLEIEIVNKRLRVINATEGGARIDNTEQMPLHEVNDQFCNDRIKPVAEVLKEIANYPLSGSHMQQVIKEQYKYFLELKQQFEKQRKTVKRLKLSKYTPESDLKLALDKIDQTEKFFNIVLNNWLLRHLLQPATINSVWNLYQIELVATPDNVITAKDVNLGFLDISVYVLSEIVSILETTAKELQS